MTNHNSSDLYWQGGKFRCRILYPESISLYEASKAMRFIEEFRSYCYEQEIIFVIATMAKDQWLKSHKHIFENSKDNTMFFGTQNPAADEPQSPGNSTTSSILHKDLLEMLKTGGNFESQLSNQFIVFVYHLWDENFRYKIADSLSISKNQVECDLMGDIRHIRNSIIHEKSDIRQADLNHLKMLSQIWNLKPGKLVISWQMIHSLMEQINALYVKIKE